MLANDNKYMSISEGLLLLDECKAFWEKKAQMKKEAEVLPFEEILNMKKSIERIETIKKQLLNESTR